jgi:hypothetical protein
MSDETLLFSTGLLDSFSVAVPLVFLDEQGGFTVEPTGDTLDNLDSVEKVLAIVRRKYGTASS